MTFANFVQTVEVTPVYYIAKAFRDHKTVKYITFYKLDIQLEGELEGWRVRPSYF